MAEAHIAALLPTQNRVVSADENTAFLAHYDLNEHDVLRGVQANGYPSILKFDRSTVEIPLTNFDASILTRPFTIETWVKFDAVNTGQDNGIFCGGTQASLQMLHIVERTGKFYFAFYSNDLQGVTALTANTWYHLACVYDGTKKYIYINGQLDTSAASGVFSPPSTPVYPYRIGIYATAAQRLGGQLYNFRIYTRAKTAQQIANEMYLADGSESNLYASFKLSDGTGSIVRDSSPFHNDSVITGTVNWAGGNSVFTLRNVDGYFGGGTIAVEEASNNIITTPHSYPTIGNAWGTYQTNQYNNGNFFSIGTINSVINNEVNITWATGVKFRTYDVVRPQTTGGGLTANTDYFIKMTSDTTFTIHQYDGTQDGSKGFSVHDPIKNDVRIAINATNFPTMWYGAPHKPNSGLVKEVISNGFTNNGVTHDCLRMYTNYADQTQAWTDYMAYGVGPAMTANTAYTVSFYYRAVTPETIGRVVNYQMHNGAGFGYGTFTLQRDWQRYEAVVTPSVTGACSLYWNAGKGVVWDIAEIQLEQRSSATSFMTTARPAGSLLYPNPIPNATEFTIAFWMKKTGTSVTGQQAFLCIDKGTNADGVWIDEDSGQLRAFIYPTDGSAATIAYTTTYNVSQWTHIAVTATQTAQTLYVNGSAVSTVVPKPFSLQGQLSIGKRLAVTAYSNILIDELRIDKVARTADEIAAWYYSNSPFWPRGIYRKTY